MGMLPAALAQEMTTGAAVTLDAVVVCR